MARRVVSVSLKPGFARRILAQTAEALAMGDIDHGHVMIKFSPKGPTGSAALFYKRSWRRKENNNTDPDFFVGEWRSMEDSPNE